MKRKFFTLLVHFISMILSLFRIFSSCNLNFIFAKDEIFEAWFFVFFRIS